VTVTVLGCDPGFASSGVAIVELLPTTERVLHLGVIRTEKDNKKRNTLAADDNMRRTREIYRELKIVAQASACVAIAIEAESPMRNASAAAKVSKVHAVVGCLAEELGLPITACSPQRMKKVLCGQQTASKDEIQAALLRRYGNEIEDLFHGPDGLFEHPMDALGAIVVGLDSEVIRMARAMARVA
jgi:Holliday junction resolvasome RuvABC endonuclease subunit